MRAIIVAVAFAVAGCATAPEPHAVNLPVTDPTATTQDIALEGDVLALSFSGGGARAAAFSLGALQGLRDMHASDGRPLLSHVSFVTAVSGGAITAAYFAQHGASGLDSFRGAYIDKDWANESHTSPYSPLNWARALRGGLNDQTVLADWLNREVFAGRPAPSVERA